MSIGKFRSLELSVATLAAIGLTLSAGSAFQPAYGGRVEGRSRRHRRIDRHQPPRTRRVLSKSGLPRGRKVRVAFFDADSTLRVPKRGIISPKGPDDVRLLPGVATKIGQLPADTIKVIISNQGGVARGKITKAKAEQALAETARLLAREGAEVHYFDFAEAYDHDRKPDTGMAERLADTVRRELGAEIDWAHSFMVGDAAWKRAHEDRKSGKRIPAEREPSGRPGIDFSNSDRKFAENVRELFGLGPDGFAFHHPRDFFGWAERGVRRFEKAAEVDAFLEENPDFPR